MASRIPADTDPEAAAVQLDLVRRAGPARRLALALSLSRTVIELSRSGLAGRDPGAAEEDIALRFVALNYGDDLATDLRSHLARSRR